MSAALPQNIRLGISLIVFGAFVISVQDVVFKTWAAHLNLWQVFAVRGFIALPVLLILIAIWQRGLPNLRELAAGFAPWPLLRAATFTFTLLAFYAALPKLSLATVGAANYTAPLFVAMLSALVIGERVRAVGWAGIVLGFGGLLLLLRPGTDAFSPWVLLPVFGAMSYAVSHVITRTKCQHLAPTTLSLAQNTLMMLSGFVISGVFLLWQPSAELIAAEPQIFGPWPNLEAQDYGILTFMALLTILASTLLARAYQAAPPATVATFEYSYLIFAAFWDALIAELPDALGFTGIALIALAGVLVVRTASLLSDSTPS